MVKLGWNEISDKGAKNIADAIKENSSITEVDLSGNHISNKELKALKRQ